MDPSMMDPSMMKMAQDMMDKMTPEQIAAMQQQAAGMDPAQVQQAMNMMKSMTPEQRAQMENMAANSNPDDLLRQADAAKANQANYKVSSADRLKQEGNRLYREGKYAEACGKYNLSLDNLNSIATREANALQKSCHSNLANCYLQMQDWTNVVQHCNLVLVDDRVNMKALYRRGQAHMGMKKYQSAVKDLEAAMTNAGSDDRIAIQEKLDSAKSLAHRCPEQPEWASRDLVSQVTIEEVTESVEVVQDSDGMVEEIVDSVHEEQTRMYNDAHTTVSENDVHDKTEILKSTLDRDPNAIKNAAKMMESMSPEALEAMIKNMPGAPPGMQFDPEQMKMAAKMMESMSAEDIQRMTELSKSFGMGPGTGMQPSAPATGGTGAASNTPEFPNATMDEMTKMLHSPEMLKNMQRMMQNMDPEKLSAMLKTTGVNVTPEQATKLVNQLGSLNDKQIDKLAKVVWFINLAVTYYRNTKAMIKRNLSLFLALVVVLIALFLRWTGKF
eukprot:jgi/Picsp_1/3229/NSC_06069-R1_chloroplast-targeted protein